MASDDSGAALADTFNVLRRLDLRRLVLDDPLDRTRIPNTTLSSINQQSICYLDWSDGFCSHPCIGIHEFSGGDMAMVDPGAATWFFGWSLVISKVSPQEFLIWGVIALVPHALLAVQQAITQEVIGSKWLGISPQLPETRGVAVVDVNGARHLRAYGGLPYPNILGGWLAFGFPAVIWLAVTAKRRQKIIIWSCVAALFIIALILSHSRSAWLAVIAIMSLLVYRLYKTQSFYRLKIPAILSAIALVFALVWQWPMLTTRVTGEGRLEVRSITERVSGIQAGMDAFRPHPLLGIGHNAFIRPGAMVSIPHQIPLLVLAEIGLIGLSGIVLLFVIGFRAIPFDTRRFLIIATPLLIIAFLDHYLWSYWSGQTLASFCIIWYLLKDQDIDKVLKS